MTRRAGHSALDVRRMDELNVIGNSMNPNPVYGLRVTAGIKQLSQLDFRRLTSRLGPVDLPEVVTKKALSDGRNCRRLIRCHLPVTELAIDACVCDVAGVRKCDGLSWAVPKTENGRR